MTNDNDDLSQLITEASNEVEHRNEEAAHARPRKPIKGKYKPLLPVFLFAIALVVYDQQQPEIPNSEAIASELSDLLRQARQSIEEAVVDEQYPAILPNAALGALVSYTVFPEGYFLSIESHQVIAEMNHQGQLTISGID